MSLSRFFSTGIPDNREKGELGELGDQEQMEWNSLSKVSGGLKGKIGSE